MTLTIGTASLLLVTASVAVVASFSVSALASSFCSVSIAVSVTSGTDLAFGGKLSAQCALVTFDAESEIR